MSSRQEMMRIWHEIEVWRIERLETVLVNAPECKRWRTCRSFWVPGASIVSHIHSSPEKSWPKNKRKRCVGARESKCLQFSWPVFERLFNGCPVVSRLIRSPFLSLPLFRACIAIFAIVSLSWRDDETPRHLTRPLWISTTEPEKKRNRGGKRMRRWDERETEREREKENLPHPGEWGKVRKVGERCTRERERNFKIG